MPWANAIPRRLPVHPGQGRSSSLQDIRSGAGGKPPASLPAASIRNGHERLKGTLMDTKHRDQFRFFLKDIIRKRIDFSETDQNRGVAPPPIEKPFPPD